MKQFCEHQLSLYPIGSTVSLKTSAIASENARDFYPHLFRLYSRKNSSVDTFHFFSPVHSLYFKLLIRLVTSFVESFFFFSRSSCFLFFFQKRREFGHNSSRETINGFRSTDLTKVSIQVVTIYSLQLMIDNNRYRLLCTNAF